MSRAIVVADLGFGDAGKGTVIDHLARVHRAVGVVRFNGGAQAGHNVVTDDGRHHTFAQLGAAGFVPGVRTHLAAPFVLHPTALLVEAAHLARKGVEDPIGALSLSPEALVITPYHQALNQARERARGEARHGTCGVGVGETVALALRRPDLAPRARDLARPAALRARLGELRAELQLEIEALVPHGDPTRDVFNDPALPKRWVEAATRLSPHLRDDREALGPWLRGEGTVLFEGAQGVLLDEWYGFHPHTTWSTCTFDNALALLASCAHQGPVQRLGVLRTYATRHGAGPLPTEDPGFAAQHPEAHNHGGGWQGSFRAGPFDLVLARYALAACGGADALALTHADAVDGPWPVCVAYEGVHDPAFELRDGRAVALRPRPVRNLEGQRRVGERLGGAQPVFEHLATDVPRALAERLGLPLALVSWGPRARDKR